MSNIVVSVENVSKRYLIGHQSQRRESLRDIITREARSFGRKTIDLIRGRQIIQGDDVEEFWALKNISFEVEQGEVIGIIGRNGAGKSTLLKILSRITEPTEGRVRVRGRVRSLLEVGTGFHPELTGRENVYLNGAILGMSHVEIKQKFDEIVAFAEIDKFLDTPVKRYSSGMYVRLAFAVAAHLEPDIMIVDEVLAVGDADFQKKCLGKMNEVSRRQGRTVVFVSHNMGAVSSLCRSVVWIESGMIRRRGEPKDVIGEYLVHGKPNANRCIDLSANPRAPDSDDRLRLESLEWLCDLPLRHGEPLQARINFKARAPLTDIAVGIGFSNLGGTRLLSCDTDFQDGSRQTLSRPGSYSVKIELDSLPLGPDVYSLDIGCRSGDSHSLDYLPAAAQIEIVAGPRTHGYMMRNNGGVRLASNWTWQGLDESTRSSLPNHSSRNSKIQGLVI